MRGWLGQFRTIRSRRGKQFETVYVGRKRGKVLRSTAPPRIDVPLDTVCFIILKARQYSQRDYDTGSDDAFNPSEGIAVSVVEEKVEDAVEEELLSIIADLNEDQQIDLVALAWLGRGDAELSGWRNLRAEARRLHNSATGRYLLSDPLIADYLEAGLALLGLSCAETEENRP